MTTRYTKDHEWVRLDGDIATIGITAHAQEQLGEVVFVEVPDVGKQFAEHAPAAVVESVKAASEVFAPLAGEVVEANADLAGTPAMVNEDAEGKAWFFKMRITDKKAFDALLDKAAYDAFVAENA